VREKYLRKANANCLVCGKPFYKRPGQMQINKGRVFCSPACYGISCRKEKPCVVCGKPVLASLNKHTCSRSCANKNRTGICYRTGARKDKVKTQRLLKARLLKDRGMICERCNFEKTEILQVHHKNRDRNDNRMENLELICPNCHYSEHHMRRSSSASAG
jgi:hypothetical protein